MKGKTFFTSVEDSKNLLKKFELLKNSNNSKKEISKLFSIICRKEDYIKIYNTALNSNDYHLLLFDDSFFQFELSEFDKKPLLRYSFYQTPYDFLPYKEYLESKDLKFNEVGYEYQDEYEQVLNEAPIKETFLSIRYDYSEKEYKTGVHSVSHFHIGFRSPIRITSSIFITPLLFVIFIIKNVYSKKWPSLINDDDFLKQYKKVKDKCESIEETFFQELDKIELYLV